VASGQGPDDLRHLVEHSASVGALSVAYSDQLSGALDLRRLTVEDLLAGHAAPSAVRKGATAAEVQEASRASGHLRILVQGAGGRPDGVVHVRDTLLLADDAPVADVTRPVFELAADVPLHSALTSMRETGNHLAIVVRDGDAPGYGVVTLADVLRRLLPRTTAARPA
jgi:CBS domain containing-hemolysin-like protein